MSVDLAVLGAGTEIRIGAECEAADFAAPIDQIRVWNRGLSTIYLGIVTMVCCAELRMSPQRTWCNSPPPNSLKARRQICLSSLCITAIPASVAM